MLANRDESTSSDSASELNIMHQLQFKAAKKTLIKRELTASEMTTLCAPFKGRAEADILLKIAISHLRLQTMQFLITNATTLPTPEEFKQATSTHISEIIKKAIKANALEFLEYVSVNSLSLRQVIDEELQALDDETLSSLPSIHPLHASTYQRHQRLTQYKTSLTQITTAIRNHDIETIKQLNSDMSTEEKAYLCVLAASLGKTDILSDLMKQQIYSADALKNWARGTSPTLFILQDSPPLETCEKSIAQAIEQKNRDWLHYMSAYLTETSPVEPITITSLLTEQAQLNCVYVAIENDDVDTLSILVNILKFVVTPSEYLVPKPHFERRYKDQEDYTKYKQECQHGKSCSSHNVSCDVREKGYLLPAREKIEYKSAFLRAAFNEKLQTLEWLLENQSDSITDNDWNRSMEL